MSEQDNKPARSKTAALRVGWPEGQKRLTGDQNRPKPHPAGSGAKTELDCVANFQQGNALVGGAKRGRMRLRRSDFGRVFVLPGEVGDLP